MTPVYLAILAAASQLVGDRLSFALVFNANEVLHLTDVYRTFISFDKLGP